MWRQFFFSKINIVSSFDLARRNKTAPVMNFHRKTTWADNIRLFETFARLCSFDKNDMYRNAFDESKSLLRNRFYCVRNYCAVSYTAVFPIKSSSAKPINPSRVDSAGYTNAYNDPKSVWEDLYAADRIGFPVQFYRTVQGQLSRRIWVE